MVLALLRVYLVVQNSFRNREQGVVINPEEVRKLDLRTDAELALLDETHKQNRKFRYIL